MTKPLSCYLVVRHFHDQLCLEGDSLGVTFGRPPTGTTGRTTGKSVWTLERLEKGDEQVPLVGGKCRRAPDVIEQAVFVIEAEQERRDFIPGAVKSETAHYTVGGAPDLCSSIERSAG